ncbi:MAG TPA: hypothetical protein VFM34_07160 [Moraxellaceae bacterium]|nr:hypothetical protein [Moraxellaceae bacterium]
MLQRLIITIALLGASAAANAELYLVVRNKIDATDYVNVSFLSDPRMKTRDACETERKAAQTTGFQIFSGTTVLRTHGASSQMRYSCLESRQKFTRQGSTRGSGFTYLVDVQGKRFTATPYSTLGQCQAVAGRGNQSSETHYCARSVQRLLR